MILFKNILEEGNKKEYEYGCLMATLNIPQWKDYYDFIDKKDIYNNPDKEYGLEEFSHCTILYGFNLEKTNKESIVHACKNIKPFHIKLQDISVFENDEYDVLKIDCQSYMLHKLNKWFSEHFEYTNVYDEYLPHATLCYLKKGTGEKYIDSLKIKIHDVLCTQLEYSERDKDDKTYIRLK